MIALGEPLFLPAISRHSLPAARPAPLAVEGRGGGVIHPATRTAYGGEGMGHDRPRGWVVCMFNTLSE